MITTYSWRSWVITMGILCILNIFLVMLCVTRIQELRPGDISYSYLGDDFPMTLDIGPDAEVEMTFGETVHYSIDDREGISEWVSTEPDAIAYVRLGPERRVFTVAMFHELHCIRMIADALDNANDSVAIPEHIHHCLNYLRQLFLCSADQTLEPGDFMVQDFDKDRVGVTRQCRNWEAVYQTVDKNYIEWHAFRKQNGTWAW